MGWKVDYLIMAASNQVINVLNMNALQNQKPVYPNIWNHFNAFVSIKHKKISVNIRILHSWDNLNSNCHKWCHLLNYVNKNKSLPYISNLYYGINSLLKVSKQHIRRMFVKYSYYSWYCCHIHEKSDSLWQNG